MWRLDSDKCSILCLHGGYLIRSRTCLTFARTWVHPRFLVGSVLLIFLVICVVFSALFIFVTCFVCPVFLDYPFLIAPSFFSNVYLHLSLSNLSVYLFSVTVYSVWGLFIDENVIPKDRHAIARVRVPQRKKAGKQRILQYLKGVLTNSEHWWITASNMIEIITCLTISSITYTFQMSEEAGYTQCHTSKSPHDTRNNRRKSITSKRNNTTCTNGNDKINAHIVNLKLYAWPRKIL